MLNALIGSETRIKLLNLFLLYPDKQYNLRALSRDLGLSLTAIKREVESLMKFGLLNESNETEKKTSGKSFRANEKFILYPEIRALFIKAQILSSQKFLTGLQKICQPKFLALTGLFTNYPESQTDILVVGQIRRTAFLKLIKDLEKDLGREINFTILSEKEFHYRREIMDIFLYNILEGKTLILLDNTKRPTSL